MTKCTWPNRKNPATQMLLVFRREGYADIYTGPRY